MTNQNFSNHARYRPLHHFIITPLTLIGVIWSVLHAFGDDLSTFDRLFPVIIALALFLLGIQARLYGNENQDRIIRLELRLRYFHLTGQSFTEKESQLRRGQIVALRFASDEEFLSLLDRAIAEGMTSKEIKVAIQSWRGDYWRV